MSNKQKRLHEVYDHLRRWYGIHTQTDFANSMRYSRNAISLALNGNEKYLTDSLFKNICEAYPGVFDLDYLLTGDGQLLTIEEEVKDKDIENLYKPQPIDNSSLVNAVIAAKDETIDSLKRELAAKNETIALQHSRIADLERQLAAATHDLSRYPFTMGVAEDNKQSHI